MPGAHSLCLSIPQGQILTYPTLQYQVFKSPVLLKDSGVTIASCMFSPVPLQPFPLVSDTVVDVVDGSVLVPWHCGAHSLLPWGPGLSGPGG